MFLSSHLFGVFYAWVIINGNIARMSEQGKIKLNFVFKMTSLDWCNRNQISFEY